MIFAFSIGRAVCGDGVYGFFTVPDGTTLDVKIRPYPFVSKRPSAVLLQN